MSAGSYGITALVTFVVAATTGALCHLLLTLDEPRWLLLLLLLVPAALLHGRWRALQRSARAALGIPERPDVRHREGERALLTALAITLLIVALAGPRWGEEARTFRFQPVDLVIALDVSKSMLAEDHGLSRQAAAHLEVEALLRTKQEGRSALLPFAGIAWLQTPLTRDRSAIHDALHLLDPAHIPAQGTRIAEALREALDLFTSLERGSEHSPAYRALILLSDGEDHGGGARDAAARLLDAGVEVHVIGFGSGDGATIPRAAREAGGAPDTLRDALGREVITRLDESLLREIAEAGGGTYRRATHPGQAAQALADTLEARAGAARRLQAAARGADQRGALVLVALILLALTGGRGRSPAARRRLTHSLLVLLLAGGSGCTDTVDTEAWNAIEALDTQGDAEAVLEALDALPPRVRARGAWSLNRGIVLLSLERPAEAQHAFLEALQRREAGVRGPALIGLGNALAEQGEWRAAAERFAMALELSPDDPVALHNLQVARDMLHPPCTALLHGKTNHRVEDAAPLTSAPAEHREEPMRTEALGALRGMPLHTPTHAGALKTTGFLCPGRPNYYRLDTSPGAELLVDLHMRPARTLPGEEGSLALPGHPLPIPTLLHHPPEGEGPAIAEGALRWFSDAPEAGHATPRPTGAGGEVGVFRRIRVSHPESAAGTPLYLRLEPAGALELHYRMIVHTPETLAETWRASWMHRIPDAVQEEASPPTRQRDWRALLDSLPAEGNLALERALRSRPVERSATPW